MLDFDDIELASLFVSGAPYGTNSAYLDKDTGEIYYESSLGDSDELPDDLDDEDKYVLIPHRTELDLGQELVEQFVTDNIPDKQDEIRRIFQKKGAYSRLKELLDARGVLDKWHKFEQQAMEAALRSWCEETGLAIKGSSSDH